MDAGVLDHPCLPLLAPLDDLKKADPLLAVLDSSAGGGRGSALPVPSRARAVGRARVRGWAAARWRDRRRRCREAWRRSLALAVGACAAAGGHILAVGVDLVGSACGPHQRLERHRARPMPVVGTLASLPSTAQPGTGRPGRVGADRRLPAVAVS